MLDTYCRTLLLAYQLRTPIQRIAPQKMADLLKFKQRLGLPDPRLKEQEHPSGFEFPKPFASQFLPEPPGQLDMLVRSIAEAVAAHLGERK